MALLAPSILSADFACLGDEVAAAARGGAGLVHVDVMDGHFVPNLTLGPAIVASLKKATDLFLDCHLMIEDPDRIIPAFAKAGAGSISVHVEAVSHLHGTIQLIRDQGVRAGVAVNPATPVEALDVILPDLDYVLIMSVNPGFSGQVFIPSAVDKIRALARRIEDLERDVAIEVDGGVGPDNARLLAEAGAGILVAGSAVFGGGDPQGAARRLAELIGDVGRPPEWLT